MKKLIIAIILGFTALIVLLAAIYFNSLAPEAINEHGQWASFGTYIGGVLTPIVVLAGLLVLIQSNRAHHSEMERLINQGHKADLLHFIEKIESDIASTFDQLTININVAGSTVNHPSSDVLLKISMLEWEKVIPTENEIKSHSDQSSENFAHYDSKILSFEVFGMVAAYLNRLRDHCEEYDHAAGNKITSLYFAKKYKLATQRLNAKGYGIDVWDPKA